MLKTFYSFSLFLMASIDSFKSFCVKIITFFGVEFQGLDDPFALLTRIICWWNLDLLLGILLTQIWVKIRYYLFIQWVFFLIYILNFYKKGENPPMLGWYMQLIVTLVGPCQKVLYPKTPGQPISPKVHLE